MATGCIWPYQVVAPAAPSSSPSSAGTVVREAPATAISVSPSATVAGEAEATAISVSSSSAVASIANHTAISLSPSSAVAGDIDATISNTASLVPQSAAPAPTMSVIGGTLVSAGNETESCDGEDASEDVWVDDDEAVEEDEDEDGEPYCDEVEGYS